MEVQTPKATRRSTRLRVEIPVTVTSLDRRRPFSENCEAILVSAQGCGLRSPRGLPAETPIMIGDLPSGGSVTARVANCLPLGSDGKYFLIGAALYTHGNFWGIADPPEDWNAAAPQGPHDSRLSNPPPAPGVESDSASVKSPQISSPPTSKKAWPYNIFATGNEAPLGRK
ncbi:MAG TPA: hypothetical protein VIW68_07225 [Candidatus Sulfotelmatobacter sp.]